MWGEILGFQPIFHTDLGPQPVFLFSEKGEEITETDQS
jgi:hypothetical protein